MTDIHDQLANAHRELRNSRIPAGELRTVLLRRTYDAPIEDVWEACTDPERIKRWFLPVTGDLRLGGSYQLEGNAGGEIVRCEPPRVLKVTWRSGEDPTAPGLSEVELRLSAGAAGRTVLELEHAATVDPDWWARYGPGAVGVGWDLTLLGLGLHLRNESIGDLSAWEQSSEAKEFIVGSSDAWRVAHEAAGATHTEASTASEYTAAFYAPDTGTPAT
jgi:uncharacterized protein YndB with AHSA1/START domain